MYPETLAQKIVAKFPGTSLVPPPPDKFVRDPNSQVMVPPEKLHDVCRSLKSDVAFNLDFPVQMTSVDYIKENQFELVYYLYSTKNKEAVILKSRISRSDAAIDSVTDVWPGFDWQEREVFDLMGIKFNNHPNLKRIMMWDGFPGFQLRKDYVHITDRFDSGLEIGTPGLNEKGVPIISDKRPA